MPHDPLSSLCTPLVGVGPSGVLDGRQFQALPAALLTAAAQQWGLVSRRQAEQNGVKQDRRRRLLAAGRWAEVTRGVYLVLPDAVDVRDWPNRVKQRATVARLTGGPGTFPSGLSALALAGFDGVPLTFRPEFVALRGFPHSTPDLRVRRLVARSSEREPLMLLSTPSGQVVAPPWALAQVAGEIDRETLVCLIDSGLNTGLLTPDLLDRTERLLTGTAGARAFREARQRSSPGMESVLETRGRLQFEDHHVPPDGVQRVIHDANGRFVARCDQVWDLGGGRLLIVELDGDHHRRDGRIDADNDRDNRLAELGHLVIHLTWAQVVTGEAWRIVARILAEHGVLAQRLA